MQAYIDICEIEMAEKIINELGDSTDKLVDSGYVDSDMNSFIILGNFYNEKGEDEKALEYYEKVYNSEKTRNNKMPGKRF